MPEGWRPRGVTPSPRSGAAAGKSYPMSEVKGSSQEELSHIQGQGSGRECQAATAQEWLRGATPCPRSGAATKSARLRQGRSSREELPHARGQGWPPRGAIPRPRSSGCVSSGGPRGAIPRLRSGEAAVRRYPSSKVRSRGCTLLK